MTAGIYSVVYDYQAQTAEELDVSQGDLVILRDGSDPDWVLVQKRSPDAFQESKEGLVPWTYIEKVSALCFVVIRC